MGCYEPLARNCTLMILNFVVILVRNDRVIDGNRVDLLMRAVTSRIETSSRKITLQVVGKEIQDFLTVKQVKPNKRYRCRKYENSF